MKSLKFGVSIVAFFMATVFSLSTILSLNISLPFSQSMYASSIVKRDAEIYSARDLEIGDYIENLGQYEGNPIKWRVVDIDENGVLLRTDRTIGERSLDAPINGDAGSWSTSNPNGYFGRLLEVHESIGSTFYSQRNGGYEDHADEYNYAVDYRGTNFYQQTDLREFLNTIVVFNESENTAIIQVKQRQILSWIDSHGVLVGKGDDYLEVKSPSITNLVGAMSGSSMFYMPTLNGVDVLSYVKNDYSIVDNAKSYTLNDKIFLQDLKQVALLSEKKQLLNINQDPYYRSVDAYGNTASNWIRTPFSLAGMATLNGLYQKIDFGYENYYIDGNGYATTSYARENHGVNLNVYLSLDSYFLSMRATDNNAIGALWEQDGYKTYSEIVSVPTLDQRVDLVKGTTGVDYTDTISVVGNNNLALEYGAINLPKGLSLNSSTGELSGVPMQVGNFKFDVTVSNIVGMSSQTYNLAIDKGDAVEDVKPELSISINKTVLDLKPQLVGTGYTILEQDSYVFDDVGQVDINARFNKDINNFNDIYTTVVVMVSDKAQHDKPDSSIMPIFDDIAVGMTTIDLNKTLPNGFHFVTDVAFMEVGATVKASLHYNSDSTQYIDYIESIDIAIKHKGKYEDGSGSGSGSGAKTVPKALVNGVPQVGYKVEDKLRLTTFGYEFNDPQFVFLTASEQTIGVRYNVDVDNYENYNSSVITNVIKGNYGATEDSLPVPNNDNLELSYKGVVGHDLQELDDGYLPNGWSVDKNQVLKQAGLQFIAATYNIDKDNYNDYKGYLIINVDKGNYGDGVGALPVPNNPAIVNLKVGHYLGEAQLMYEWSFDNSDGQLNLREVLRQSGPREFKVIYGIDNNNYNPIKSTVIFNVQKGKYGETADARPTPVLPKEMQNIKVAQGTSLKDYKLSDNWGYNESKTDIDNPLTALGVMKISIYFNDDTANYDNYNVEITITVILGVITPPTTPDGVFLSTNVIIAIVASSIGVVVIFIIVLIAIKSKSKKTFKASINIKNTNKNVNYNRPAPKTKNLPPPPKQYDKNDPRNRFR